MKFSQLFDTSRAYLRSFKPSSMAVPTRELYLAPVGVGLGLLLTELLSHLSLSHRELWFVAPMGASAVLLFGVPASPLAQPWSVLGGNFISAFIGITCHQLFGGTAFSMALAGLLAVAAMLASRCLHPPGGAMAVTAALGSPAINQLGFGFVLWPVAINSLLMLVLALLFNKLAGRHYPHQALPPANPHLTTDALPTRRSSFAPDDIDAALTSFGEVLDIDRHDLEEILVRAQMHAQQRHWANLLCDQVMARDVICVGQDSSIQQAWQLLALHKVKALPVLDQQSRLAGIVSLHDFFITDQTQSALSVPAMNHAQTVAQIMTSKVRCARPDQAIADLIHAFSDGGIHHMPVLDAERKVVGMITQSDIIAALFVRQTQLAGA